MLPIVLVCGIACQAIKCQNVSYKTDIWSLACTVIEMVTAQSPWHSKGFTNGWAAMFHIAQCERGPPFPATLSEPCEDLIVRSLCSVAAAGGLTAAHRWSREFVHLQPMAHGNPPPPFESHQGAYSFSLYGTHPLLLQEPRRLLSGPIPQSTAHQTPLVSPDTRCVGCSMRGRLPRENGCTFHFVWPPFGATHAPPCAHSPRLLSCGAGRWFVPPPPPPAQTPKKFAYLKSASNFGPL